MKLDDAEYKNMLDTLALCLGLEPKVLKPSLVISELGITQAQLVTRIGHSFDLTVDGSETFTNVGQVVAYLERTIDN